MVDIKLYHHPIGDELGAIHLVIQSPEDPENVRLILSSEKGRDLGVVFTVDMHKDDYDEICKDEGIATLEGCVLATSGDDLQVQEIPETPPPQRPEKIESKGNVQFLRNPQFWKHKWGRCCCVKHGDSVEPVTPERILAGEVPWWNSPYTPFQLDLISAGSNEETPNSMHLICQEDTICGRCEHYVWVVADEDVPDELPVPLEEQECPEPLCPQRDALADIEWTSKQDAWQVFLSDPHNRTIIEASGLPVERASQERKYSNEKAFKAVNRRIGRNLYTVKQVFYEALGNTRSGTWADFDLDLIRSLRGLKEVDVPGAILEMVELDDADANERMHKAAGHRAARAEIDDEAEILENMLDEESEHDPEEDEDEEEAKAHSYKKAKSVPRTDAKQIGDSGTRKIPLLTAAKALRVALDQFIAALEEAKAADGGPKNR